MDLNYLNIPGVTEISNNDAEKLVGGKLAVVFVAEDGKRTRRKFDGNTSGALDIPDNIKKIRVRNRNAAADFVVVDFEDGNGNNNVGDSYTIDGKTAQTVYKVGDTVRTLDSRDFTPTQITVST